MVNCPTCGCKLSQKKKERIVIGYTCDVCKKLHTNYQAAIDCEDSHTVQEASP